MVVLIVALLAMNRGGQPVKPGQPGPRPSPAPTAQSPRSASRAAAPKPVASGFLAAPSAVAATSVAPTADRRHRDRRRHRPTNAGAPRGDLRRAAGEGHRRS
ncbi:MAG: hypothetical protein U0232_25570 [Thermomicrobiales bacterium]